MAIPAIAIAIVSYIIQDRLSDYGATQKAAAEYGYFQGMKDNELMPVAIALGQQTETHYTEWFKILQTIRNYGAPGTTPTGPAEGAKAGPAEGAKGQNDTMIYMILTGLVLAYLLGGSK